MDRRTQKILEDFRDPGAMTMEEVRERIGVREANPAEFLAAKERKRAIERDEADKAAAKDAWLRAGGDARDFDREWEQISTAAKRQQMEQEQKAARESFQRYGRERF